MNTRGKRAGERRGERGKGDNQDELRKGGGRRKHDGKFGFLL